MTSPTMSPGLLRIDAAALGGAGASPCSTSPVALVKCLPLPATRRTLSSCGFQTNSTYPSRLPPELSLCFPSSTLPWHGHFHLTCSVQLLGAIPAGCAWAVCTIMFSFPFFVGGGAASVACKSSWASDQTIAVARAAAVTMPEP